ncbi:hypothetical protein HMPREF1579_00698 [Gardnerella vaginalis JCP8066]|nr:hypothetical protein HMPREF1579_00698 [Gardnerella vaginalis JCP8066]
MYGGYVSVKIAIFKVSSDYINSSNNVKSVALCLALCHKLLFFATLVAFLNHRLVAIFPHAKSAGANLPINAEYLR